MTYSLRPYQSDAVRLGARFLTTGTGHGVMVEPTGAGKSIIIAGICSALPAGTLVFQPSLEILTQNYEKLESYGYKPGVYSAKAGYKEAGSDITLATIGSVVKKPQLFQHVRYGIIDECHLVNASVGMYRDFFAALPHVRLLGLTATPYRLNNDGYGGPMLKFLTRTRPRVFDTVVHVTQNGDLFREGFLCKLDYKEVAGFVPSRVKLNSTGADYDEPSLQLHMDEIKFDGLLSKVVNRCFEVGRKRVLVFTRFTAEAHHLARTIPGCAVVTGKTPVNERRSVVDGFKSGRYRAVANVGVLAVGFDYPELDAVVLARPTKSLALYYQMVGRGVRAHPGKADCLIVDMVGCVKLFGHVEDLVVKEDDGKWAVFGANGQLTNVYFAKEQCGGSLEGLKWEPHGGRLRAVPDNRFWALWRTDKNQVFRAGISVKKIDGQFALIKNVLTG